MIRRRLVWLALCGALSASMPCGSMAQSASERKALAGTVSIGDTVRRLDQEALTNKGMVASGAGKAGIARLTVTNAKPIHLLYVHGINEVGPDDSKLLRKGICKILKECTDKVEARLYAEGPFRLGAPRPASSI